MIGLVRRSTGFGIPQCLLLILWLSVVCSTALFSQTNEIVILKNGMQIGPGSAINIATLNANSKNPENFKGGVGAKDIVMVDDGLRETYFHMRMLAGEGIPSDVPISITLPNIKDRCDTSVKIAGLFRTRGASPFNDFGRRRIQVDNAMASSGVSLFIQGITEVTPYYMRVDVLESNGAKTWDSRHSLNSIPPEQLRTILLNKARDGNLQDYLDVASLFDSAKRYQDAIFIVEQIIKEMPEMEGEMRKKLDKYRQDFADQMFDEVELRRKAGQYKIANSLLNSFDPSKLAEETKLKIQTRIREDIAEAKRFEGIVKSLRDLVKSLNDQAITNAINPIVEEIASHLNGNTIDRLAVFERMKDDVSTKAEQRVALAISGWILGGDSGIDSLTIAKSSIEARELIRQYLATHNPSSPAMALQPKRTELIEKIRGQEAGAPVLVNRILAKMLPPIPLPPALDGQPLRHVIEIENMPDGRGGDMGTVSYLIQLPPEYDPYRAYPCIVALNGGTNELMELEWWTGSYNTEFQMTTGLASRSGYIVIAPRWKDGDEGFDQITENEQFRVLASLRDAMRRTSIDSDRVFITGHGGGGTAAWDIATAQPSLWAGMICIGGRENTLIKIARTNLARMPVYFVTGELDGTPAPLAREGAIWDEYASDSIKQDFMLTLYKGRGPERFQEELPRIMEWLEAPSHRRPDFPESFEVKAARPGDRHYWWLEVLAYRNEMTPPFQKIDAKMVSTFKMSRRPIQNTMVIETMPATKYRIWLNPQIADLTKKVKFVIKGDSRSEEVSPSIEIMLEDARRRADRQHVFWAKFEP